MYTYTLYTVYTVYIVHISKLFRTYTLILSITYARMTAGITVIPGHPQQIAPCYVIAGKFLGHTYGCCVHCKLNIIHYITYMYTLYYIIHCIQCILKI